jgi:MFS family permease
MTDFNFKKWNSILGWLAFAIAFVVYSLTVERTLSFWDCGEYIATSAKLEVGHPPGAPLFQMAGAFFAMFATGPGSVALMVNMLSVTVSAFTILFMFWSLTMLLKNLISGFSEFNKDNAVMVLGSAFVGSLAFTFSDSFWFNATEAEVYAMASFFIAILMWAALKWGEEMHQPRGNRWLLLISLLIGLSFGVHFMALLTIPSIGLIYYFKNYRTITIKNFIIANLAIVAVLFFVFKFLLPYTLALFGKTEIFIVNSMGLPFNSGTIFITLVIAAFFYFGLRYTKHKGLAAYNTVLLCLLFILIGFSTWIMLPVRANANVVINENKPSDAAEVLAYYNREQYGEQKTFYGPLYTEAYANLDEENPYQDSKPNYERDYKTGKYVVVNNYKNAKQNSDDKHNGILPRMISGDHAANYMAYSGPPKFRLDPNYDYARELMNYGVDVNALTEEEAMKAIAQIKGELEGIISEFRTAYAKGDLGNEEYDKFLKSYKQYLIIEKPSFADNMAFMFEYQFGYMYWRYMMWNFTGRQSDIQGKGDNIDGNWLSGISFIDEARLGPQDSLTSDMKNNKGRNTYFFLPFILGLIGFVYHAKKDLKSFYILLALFLFTGIALKIFLNERPFEVRERDYALVGSYYVFAIWIGFGVFAIYDGIKKYMQPKIAIPLTLAATLLAAPLLMAKENWDDHDRSGRYTALSMAKAYLDSCEPNAILFTIGDNDTFPLWYAQEVEGYRTDVRIVCSTLLPTDWYIDQMKRQAYESAPMPISFTHDQYVDGTRDFIIYNPRTDERMDINDFMKFIALDDERATVEFNSGQRVNYYPTNKIRINVDREQVIKNKVVTPEHYDSIVPYIDIDLPKEAIYKHNLMMLDIIRNNKWKRPVYFSGGSFDPEDYAWMKDYLQMHGMVFKLVPVKTPVPEDGSPLDMGYIDTDVVYDIAMKWDWGNSGSPDIYHDPQTLKNSINFRKNLARLTESLIKEGKKEKAAAIIDLAMKNMPVEYYNFYFITEPFVDGYYKVGNQKAARTLVAKLEDKYKESLAYYKSLSIADQNILYMDIIGEIERYRSLLLIMKDNGDTASYNSAKAEFNKSNKLFGRFGRESE